MQWIHIICLWQVNVIIPISLNNTIANERTDYYFLLMVSFSESPKSRLRYAMYLNSGSVLVSLLRRLHKFVHACPQYSIVQLNQSSNQLRARNLYLFIH